MLLQGRGLKADEPKAVSYLLSAAEKGVAGAQNRLGHVYAEGAGVAQNSFEAAGWRLIAKANGITDDKLDLFVAALPGCGPQQGRGGRLRLAGEKADHALIWASVPEVVGAGLNHSGKAVSGKGLTPGSEPCPEAASEISPPLTSQRAPGPRMSSSALMNVMVSAARKAAARSRAISARSSSFRSRSKGPANFVSAADHKAEEIIWKELSKARPGYGFLMEERGEMEGDDKTHRWIVDPLDGTTNFLHGIPHFAISIGLEREGMLVAGVIYNPATDELFAAEKGKGAFLNDKRRLRVAARKITCQCCRGHRHPHRGRPGHPGFMRELQSVDE